MSSTGTRPALVTAGAVSLPVLLLALLVHASFGPLLSLDDAVTGVAGRLSVSHPSVTTLARGLTYLGDPFVMTVVTLVAVVILLRRGHRRLALLMLVVRMAAQVLSTLLKAVVDRPRPVFAEPVSTAYGSSFPSGHSLAAAAVWSTSAVLLVVLVPACRALWLTLGAVVPLVVGTTRVLVGVHYLSDVVAGLLLGFGTTVTVVLLLGPLRAPERVP